MSAMSQENVFNQRFEKVQFLNQGGFGVVASTVCVIDKEPRAIKLIDGIIKEPEESGSKESEGEGKELIREMDLLSKYKHENIVQYYGSWTIGTSTLNQEWKEVLKPKYRSLFPTNMTAIELELCEGTSMAIIKIPNCN